MTKSNPLSTRVLEGERPVLDLDTVEVHVIAGPDRGLKFTLGPSSVIIGTSSSCDLPLHDPTVSARHAEIARDPRGYLIRDLGSTNGLYCGKWRVDRVFLSDGMRVDLGDSALSVRGKKSRIQLPLVQAGRFGALIAHSVAMRAFLAQLESAAQSSSTVLIEGETGTGKEHAAEMVHASSLRRLGAFVVFDCAATNPSLAAAQLFGHERGAFTGAQSAMPGLFGAADGGTLLLDEVGDLPLELQPLLLRAIEGGTHRSLGGRNDVSHDVRIIATTKRNLEEMVRLKRFRQDLYFRLAVIKLRVPALRERTEDVPFLAERFAQEAGVSLSPDWLGPLASHNWPGNVRELRNTIVRGGLEGAPARRQTPSIVPIRDQDGRLLPLPEVRRHAADSVERVAVEAALEEALGNLTQAAELVGISRQSFTALAQKHRLHPRGD